MTPSSVKSHQAQKWTITAKVRAPAAADCTAGVECAARAGHEAAVSAIHSEEVVVGVGPAEAIVAVEAAGAETAGAETTEIVTME